VALAFLSTDCPSDNKIRRENKKFNPCLGSAREVWAGGWEVSPDSLWLYKPAALIELKTTDLSF
jgi:hypothetical protein